MSRMDRSPVRSAGKIKHLSWRKPWCSWSRRGHRSGESRQPRTKFMRIAYLDCFSGISGDMFLGALIDAGVPPAVLEQAVSALNLGARLEISRVNRSGISATKVDVIVKGEKDAPREQLAETPEHGCSQSHSHPHQHADDHHHELGSHQHGRGLKEIREIIRAAALSESAKNTAIAMFERLGAAEAKIHN